jgi:hypothetical protein
MVTCQADTFRMCSNPLLGQPSIRWLPAKVPRLCNVYHMEHQRSLTLVCCLAPRTFRKQMGCCSFFCAFNTAITSGAWPCNSPVYFERYPYLFVVTLRTPCRAWDPGRGPGRKIAHPDPNWRWDHSGVYSHVPFGCDSRAYTDFVGRALKFIEANIAYKWTNRGHRAVRRQLTRRGYL